MSEAITKAEAFAATLAEIERAGDAEGDAGIISAGLHVALIAIRSGHRAAFCLIAADFLKHCLTCADCRTSPPKADEWPEVLDVG